MFVHWTPITGILTAVRFQDYRREYGLRAALVSAGGDPGGGVNGQVPRLNLEASPIPVLLLLFH